MVAGAGAFLAWRVVGSWALLVETTYGWLLLAKIGIAALVAAIGGWNRWRTLPAVRAAAGFGDRERAARLVTRTVRVEAVLLVVLLGVTGVLVNKSPRPAPVTAASGTTGTGVATAGDLRVLAVMDPQRVGSNTLLVQVQDAGGRPVRPAHQPGRLAAHRRPRRRRGDGAGRSRPAPTAGRSWCRAPGEWEVQVSLRAEPLREPGDDRQVERLASIRQGVRP